MQLKLTRFCLRRFMRQNWRDARRWGRSPIELARFWRHGYSTEQVVLFDLTPDTLADYPPDSLRHRVTTETNRQVWPVLHDKMFFDSFMRGRLPVVEAAFYVIAGRVQGGAPEWGVELLREALSVGRGWVLKPCQGGGGVGLRFLRPATGGFDMDGERHGFGELPALLGRLDYHGAYPLMEQHEHLRALHPDSVNTLRVTVFRGEDGQPRLFAPVLRVGCRATAPADNFERGGLTAALDPERGVTLKALRRGEDGRRQVLERHPESGAVLTGVEVPFWREIRESLLTFHQQHPAFDWVGWDVLVGNEGFWIIEGNHNPGTRMVFLFRTLREEPALRQFFEVRGMARKGGGW